MKKIKFKLKTHHPKVNNVKVHFKLQKVVEKKILINKVNKLENYTVKRHNNYFVVRHKQNKAVYSIFPDSLFINLTGIKNFKQIHKYIDQFNADFEEEIRLTEVFIDNSTSAGKFYFEKKGAKIENIFINLEELKFLVDNHVLFQHMRFSLSPANFPGAVIRIKGWPTTLIFNSGCFTIVGGRSEQKIKETFSEICFCVRTWINTFSETRKLFATIASAE